MLPKLLIRSLILAVSLTLLPTVAQAGKNRIVELKGEAKIKLAGAINYQPVFKGMTLVLGDILLPNEGAEVIVNCSDGKRKQAQAGVPSGLKAICPSAKSTDPREGSPIFINLLDGDFIPQTLLLTNDSLLSWPSVPKATRYQVKVMANNEVIWEKMVEGTSVRYQGEPLNPKFKFYKLVVEAMDGNKLSSYGLELTKAEKVIVESVQNDIKNIDTESVSEETKALMLVDVYWEEYDKVKSGFLLAAATPLEKLVQSGNQTLVIHRLLGDIYLRLGRWQEAEEKYQKVILLAESEKNYFEIAAAQEGLAHVAVIKGDFSEAEEFLLKAKQGYQIAGDGQQVDLIQGWLEKLESKL
jgi:hypothetical protein